MHSLSTQRFRKATLFIKEKTETDHLHLGIYIGEGCLTVRKRRGGSSFMQIRGIRKYDVWKIVLNSFSL